MSDIKVSIIIPCYNVEKFIEKTILSAINQSLKEIEIIVVNDGSTDKTLDIIKKYKEKDERIILVDKKNGGLSSARNAGIKIARGEYIQHLDGDDFLEKNCCEENYIYACKNNLDIVCFNLIKEEVNKRYIINTFEDFKELLIYTREEFFHELYQKGINVSIVAKLIKRELYSKKGIFHPENISLGEDLFTIIKLGIGSTRIGKLNKEFYHYLYNFSSITNDRKGEKLIQLFNGFGEIKEYLYKNKININEKERLSLDLLKITHLGTILYCRPLIKNINYEKAVIKFINFIKNEIDFTILNKMSFQRRILYKTFKIFPNKYFLFCLANIFYYLNIFRKVLK